MVMIIEKFVRTGVAVLCAVTVADGARAADMYTPSGFKDAPAVYMAPAWQGFYIGVNGGYGWRATSSQFGYNPYFYDEVSYAGYSGIGADGGFGGGQIGYNWQGIFGNSALVAGIEADIQGAGISGKGTDSYGELFKTGLDWFGTVRARLGYAASYGALYYVTGGFAYGGVRHHGEDNSFAPPTAYYDYNGTATGYVLGGGIEYKINPVWSLKFEYQYMNLGKNDPTTSAAAIAAGYGATASADNFKISDDAYHTVRAGLNYRLQPVSESLK